MSNEIHIVSEMTDEYAYWNLQLLDSVISRANEKRLTVRQWKLEDLADAPLCDPVLVLNLSSTWSEQVLHALEARSVRCVILSGALMPSQSIAGSIMLDHRRATRDAVRYFYACGRRRIAFLGCNPRSPNDHEKRAGIAEMCDALHLPFGDEDVFDFSGDVAECVSRFSAVCDPYDAVVCSNDIIAVMLLRDAVFQQKMRVPDDMFIVSFGNSVIGRLTRPSLTTMTLDYPAIGRIAVDTVMYLRKSPEISAQHTSVTIHMRPGATTDFRPMTGLPVIPREPVPEAHYPSFYRVRETSSILHTEALLAGMDTADLFILYLLLTGDSLSFMADKTFLSESSCKYRIRRMQQKLGVDDRKALVSALSEWIDAEALCAYIFSLTGQNIS